jgi:mannose-6-phosphate isomerase-like protein (cupin superfamily)
MTVRTIPTTGTSDEVETFAIPGNRFRVIEDGTATDGRVAVVECELDPGWAGPPQHVHHAQDETFFILSGAVRFTSGTDSFVATAGQHVTVPQGDPHTFGNADAHEPARLLGTVAPARFLDFFRELSTMQPAEGGRPDPAQMLRLMERYDTAPHRG